MDNQHEILQEVRCNRDYIIQILQRLTKLEEKHSRTSAIYGILGGFLPAAGMFIWWLVGT